MTNLELTLAFGAMGIAVLAMIAASLGAIIQFEVTPSDIYRKLSQRYWARKVNEAISHLEPEPLPIPNYRHNIHCPSCGRFAKRVFQSNEMVECKHHGVLIRWKDLPVDWISRPIAPGVTLQVEIVPAIEPIEFKEVSLSTGPIPIIIVPNDLSEFESWGARI